MGFGGAEDLGNFRQGCGVNFQKPMCVFVVFGRGFVHIDHARSEPKRTLIHERLDFIGQFKPPSQSLDCRAGTHDYYDNPIEKDKDETVHKRNRKDSY